MDRRKGKFRAFLLAALWHFLANEQDRSCAQKRGGGKVVISLDGLTAERRYQLEPAHNLTPEKLFDSAPSRSSISVTWLGCGPM